MPAWASVLIALAAFIIGGGTIGKSLARLLQAGAEKERDDRLKLTFTERAELNAFRAAVTAENEKTKALADMALHQVELSMAVATKAADEVREQARRFEGHQQIMMAKALEPIEKMERRMEMMVENQGAQAASIKLVHGLLERLTQEFDRERERRNR